MSDGKTLTVKNEGAVLRFIIVDEAKGRIYRPVAVTFARLRKKMPRRAVFVSAGNQVGIYTAFSSLQLNGSTLEITDTLPGGASENTPVSRYKTYQSSIMIQRDASGTPGIVLFSVENTDDGSVDNSSESGDDIGSVCNDNESDPEPQDGEAGWVDD